MKKGLIVIMLILSLVLAMIPVSASADEINESLFTVNTLDGKIALTGYEVFRSENMNDGYGEEPFFITTNEAYINTNAKLGVRYYYKVRGYVLVNGTKYYTDYSNVCYRTVKKNTTKLDSLTKINEPNGAVKVTVDSLNEALAGVKINATTQLVTSLKNRAAVNVNWEVDYGDIELKEEVKEEVIETPVIEDKKEEEDALLKEMIEYFQYVLRNFRASEYLSDYYYISSDGHWETSYTHTVLEGTTSPYITVLGTDGKPTTVIPLTSNATVGNGNVTISGNNVTYTNTGEAQNVLITTNSYDTIVTINAPNDTVKHYGKVNKVEITAVADHSYYESGMVLGNIILHAGRVVLENGAKANAVYISSDATNIADDSVIINVDTTKEPEIPVIIEELVNTAVTTKAAILNNSNGINASNIVVVSSKVLNQGVRTEVDAEATILKSDNSVVNYATFKEAFNAMVDGDTLILMKDITLSEELVKGVSGNTQPTEHYTIDLNGYTITTTSQFAKHNDGYDGALTLYNIYATLKNGHIDDRANNVGATINILDNANVIFENLALDYYANSTCYGSICTDTVSEDITNSTLKLVLNNCTVNSGKGYCSQFCGKGVEVTLNDCHFNQTFTGTVTKNFAQCCVAVASACKVIINGGTYTGSSEYYCLVIQTSGGMITTNSGTFSAKTVWRIDNQENAVDWAGNSNYASGAVAVINGGSFTGLYSFGVDNPSKLGNATVTINGGDHEVIPTSSNPKVTITVNGTQTVTGTRTYISNN